MTDELDVPKSNKQERIEVIGIHDKRTILKDSLPETSPDDYTKPQTTEIVEKLAKKFYINGKDSPLRDIYEYFTTKEKAIKKIVKSLQISGYHVNPMEEPSRRVCSKSKGVHTRKVIMLI